ncbi:RadC family protein [Microbacter margulisiae]|uniref:DNA repair protein RadC n=1 Tax=Microbacter margulisiae TaxID=1350067 RepID=A0A7W5H2Y6_9PORP|nr:DNA repair protein RadC [Microbacter margulisiae]MBB3187926.1 DNA repair protein RadC [Microbacter margulisiae]
MEKRLSIKDWKEEDRPREKLIDKGSRALSDAELLAILIGSGNKEESAVELSRRILHQLNNSLDDLGKVDIPFLTKSFKGIGEAKAITILAALELGRRRKLSEATERTKISESQDVFHVFEPLLSDIPHEEFWVLLLNRANKIIGQTRLSQGGTGQTVVEIPQILKFAIDKLATGIIVCHNHPSGNTEPSTQDMQITTKLAEACKIMSISLLDHLIIAHHQYYSFADNGRIPSR